MKQAIAWLMIFGFLGFVSCARKDINRHGDIRLRGEKPVALKEKRPGDLIQKGTASWYGKEFNGRRTSNGEIYNMNDHTAAHKTLPFNTLIRVVNQENGSETVVRINDRGPFVKGRIIDLSRAAARDLGMHITGVAKVKLFLEKGRQARNREQGVRSHSEGQWTIQIGSFGEFLRARQLVVRFEDCGSRVRIEKFENMYRVRIGSFKTKKEAEKFSRMLDLDDLDVWILED